MTSFLVKEEVEEAGGSEKLEALVTTVELSQSGRTKTSASMH